MAYKPNVCILKTDGTNCDNETSYAFEKAGGICKTVHLNQLRNGADKLFNYQILAISGGFSYGDDIASGKVLALELTTFLRDQLRYFVALGKLIIGICNGFQVLVRTGLLPFGNIGKMEATLAHNSSGHFECRWVNLEINSSSPCVFTLGMAGVKFLQIAHGEGKFYADGQALERIEKENLAVIRYLGANPNGSLNCIAGICDPTGRIFGLMPHPERFVELTQYPEWRRFPENVKPHGLKIFENAVDYFK
ncbi:MAG: phosphoribosylformylglycinamidine synthase subunit PurQ [Candidatus Pacebacteria bacterium]|nr:phosphoribosylformylglycinamidine synthase subunit PurQ [Candidatus Paceibacterota bacterium]NUQ57262.1 phosphoribosylformylglycinamidine synthase subunit PurQ [Candidatus Paceibacter sp.]